MANYYNSMLIGSSRTIGNCQKVYDNLRGYNIFVIGDCGYGIDGTCNKRIKYNGGGGINDVRAAFAKVIANLGLELGYIVNSKGSCIF